MFHRLQVLVNDLKALGEEVKDKDFSHKFLRCLPSRFGMLVTLLVRSSLDTMTPNQVLGDVMTDDTYRDDNEKEEKNEKKDEKKDEKKSVAFKAASSSKSKGKVKQDESSEDDEYMSFDELDDEKMALFVKRFGKFMMKKGYRARRKKSTSRSKDEPRRCFKCGSKDHLVAQCPYNSENEDDDKKSKKKDKKEKKESKMTFKHKKGGSYVITWIVMLPQVMMMTVMMTRPPRRRLLQVLVSMRSLLSSTLHRHASCMAKATKVQKYDESDCESNDDDEPTKVELIDMLEDAKTHFDIKRRECKDLNKELKALKQAFDELNASHEKLEEAHEKLGKRWTS
jgi:hypothetical protein